MDELSRRPARVVVDDAVIAGMQGYFIARPGVYSHVAASTSSGGPNG